MAFGFEKYLASSVEHQHLYAEDEIEESDEEMTEEEINYFIRKHNLKIRVLNPDIASFFEATCERYRKND